uniref:Phosphatidylinositol transfer protein SEC14 n=1 Tax=Glossina morsitans morsitans TaxID=37546 RepID=D3TPJ5_GLOMM
MLQIRPLNEDLQRKAIEELNEVPTRIHEDLKALRSWIEQQPHLCANTDDQFLIAFLRGCKYSLEKVKKKIDSYYSLKSKFPVPFNIADVADTRFRHIFRLGLFLPLPNPLHDNGPRIFYIHGSLPEMYSVEDAITVKSVLQDIFMLEDDYAVINGLIAIIDLTAFNFSYVFQLTPMVLKKFIAYDYEAMPLRVKAVHYINAPKIYDTVYKIFLPMLPQNHQNRIFFHSSLESLCQNVPLKYLPKDIGGENGSIAEMIDELDKKLDQYQDYFSKRTQWGVDEKLRIGKAKDYNSMFGVEGSFKKLEVD